MVMEGDPDSQGGKGEDRSTLETATSVGSVSFGDRTEHLLSSDEKNAAKLSTSCSQDNRLTNALSSKLSDGEGVRERPKPAQLDLATHLKHGPNKSITDHAGVAESEKKFGAHATAVSRSDTQTRTDSTALVREDTKDGVFSQAQVVGVSNVLRRVSFVDTVATNKAPPTGAAARLTDSELSSLQVGSPVIALYGPSQDAILESDKLPVFYEEEEESRSTPTDSHTIKSQLLNAHSDRAAKFSNENIPEELSALQSHPESQSHPHSQAPIRAHAHAHAHSTKSTPLYQPDHPSSLNLGAMRKARQSSPLAITPANNPNTNPPSPGLKLSQPRSFGELSESSLNHLSIHEPTTCMNPAESHHNSAAAPSPSSATSPSSTTSPTHSKSKPEATARVSDDTSKQGGRNSGSKPQRASVVDGLLSPRSPQTPKTTSNSSGAFGVFGVLSPKSARQLSPTQPGSPRVGFFRRLTSARFHRSPHGSPIDGVSASDLNSPESSGTGSPGTLATPRTGRGTGATGSLEGFDYTKQAENTETDSPRDLDTLSSRRRSSNSSMPISPNKTSAAHTISGLLRYQKKSRSVLGSKTGPRGPDPLISPDSKSAPVTGATSPRRGGSRSPRNVLATVSDAVGAAMFEPIVNPTNNARKAYIPKQSDLPENMDQDVALDASFQVYRVMIVRNKTKNEELQFKYAVKSSNLCILKLTVAGVALVPMRSRSTTDESPIYRYNNLKAINLKDPKKEKNIKIVAFEFSEEGATDVLAVASHECSEIIARLKMLLWKAKYSGHYQ